MVRALARSTEPVWLSEGLRVVSALGATCERWVERRVSTSGGGLQTAAATADAVRRVDVQTAFPQVAAQLSNATGERERSVDRYVSHAKSTRGARLAAIGPAKVAIDDGEHRDLGEGPSVVTGVTKQFAAEVDDEHAGTKALRGDVAFLVLQ